MKFFLKLYIVLVLFSGTLVGLQYWLLSVSDTFVVSLFGIPVFIFTCIAFLYVAVFAPVYYGGMVIIMFICYALIGD